MTAGTNHAATRSAMAWIGARERWALATAATMRASVVSSPTRRGLDDEAAVAVEGGAGDLVAGRLLHRDGLAGQHALVERRAAFDDEAVDRDLGAGADAQAIAGADLGERHVGLAAVGGDAAGGRGREVEERADRRPGALAGTELEDLAEQHEDDDDGRGLEIDRQIAVGVAKTVREQRRERGRRRG